MMIKIILFYFVKIYGFDYLVFSFLIVEFGGVYF